MTELVDAYLEKVPEPGRTTLTKLRASIRKMVPAEAAEAISYGMPAFKYKGGLVCYAAFNLKTAIDLGGHPQALESIEVAPASHFPNLVTTALTVTACRHKTWAKTESSTAVFRFKDHCSLFPPGTAHLTEIAEEIAPTKPQKAPSGSHWTNPSRRPC